MRATTTQTTPEVIFLGLAVTAVPFATLLLTAREGGSHLLPVAVAAIAVAAAAVRRLVGLVRSIEQERIAVSEAAGVTAAILDAVPAPVALIGVDGTIKLWNRAAERPTGLAAADVIGDRPSYEGAGRDAASDIRRFALEACPSPGLERRVTYADGREADIVLATAPVDGRQGSVPDVVASWNDVTESNARSAQFRFLAGHDAVTGLPNRWAFDDHLDRASRRCGPGRPAMLLMIDLDDFKRVDDTAGHDQGDRLLAEVGARLGAGLRPGDFLARVGGDEFAAVINDVDVASAGELAERVLESVAGARFRAGHRAFDLTLSVGACLIDGGCGPAEIYARADRVLRRAKRLGKNRVAHARGVGETVAIALEVASAA
jgi:diguanylate cyclase (GGDEF)-like protein/PAS domain S-box-containing protein